MNIGVRRAASLYVYNNDRYGMLPRIVHVSLHSQASYYLYHLTLFSRFGIEFAPEVVRADGNVRNMAWRICNAKKVLVRWNLSYFVCCDCLTNTVQLQAPYSMSRSRGTTTPTASKD